MLRNCKECGKVYQRTLSDLCPNCIRKMNDAVAQVDAYAFKNKDLTIEKIAENTKIDPDYIRKLLAEGKINSIKSLQAKCEMCGNVCAVSTTTFLCRDCVSDIKSVQTTKKDPSYPQLKKDMGSGMKSRDKDR